MYFLNFFLRVEIDMFLLVWKYLFDLDLIIWWISGNDGLDCDKILIICLVMEIGYVDFLDLIR